ncbi:dickkopf-related protein 3b [Alosa sapidissima]|uniref:dickkopf-related protein 3b n=1 Tax=Alosa sapidissima TaxID=34773 RepID=UPI001C082E46|nr:dickkopf-related protein 3b [Alosa sapidissima]
MLKFVTLFFWLHIFNGVASRTTPYAKNGIKTIDRNLAPGQITLNDMFREVEKLMEDTQHKLEEAVHQINNESAKSQSYAQDLVPIYHNLTHSKDALDDQAMHIVEQIKKETDNRTGEIHLSRTVIQTSGRWNEVDHECLIDEDCGEGSYCLYQVLTSRCIPCQASYASCGKDEECCSGQLCVWGKCSPDGVKGQSGSICQYQNDCSPENCCAFHKELLFPVCTPRPQEQQPCYSQPNMLMDLLLWDVEGPREHCPCAGGLECQPLRRGSLCLDVRGSSGEDSPDPDFL